MVKSLEIRGGLSQPPLARGVNTKQLGVGRVKTNEADIDVCFF